MIKFIDSKLQPPHLSSNVIKRPRLVERLQSNLGLCATFVCAGPGWGKTTLTAEFLDTLNVPAVWYDLDATDSDIAVFFRYLVRAVQQAIPDFGHSTTDLLRSGGGASHEQLADLFLFELAEAVDRDLVIVLDNIHYTFSSEWSSPVLYRILQLLPKGVHFILLARMAPGFTFSRMRSKQTLDHIDDRSLAFNRNEVCELFRPVFDDEGTVDKLLGWTQGWVAGLQIIRKAVESDVSLRSLEVDEIITRSESEIFDYFATKVYQAEPREIRELLVRSSLPYYITRDLLTEALRMEVSNEQLQAAVRENVFLTRLSGESDTYTFHPLFRDFLRKQLEAEITAAQLREFHRSLAGYYSERENWGLALHHFFEAGDESGATETMLNAEQPLLAAGLASTLGSYLPRFSQQTLDRNPQLYNFMGEARIIEGDSIGADEKFRLALDASRRVRDREVEAAALAGLAHSAAREHNFKEAIAHAEAAEQCVMQTRNLSDKAALRARVKNVAGAVRVFEGRYTEANDLMEEALRLAHEAADVRLIRSISHNLALPAFMEGDFHAALRYFSRSPISENSGSRRVLHPDSILLYLNRAAVYTALGKLENAERDLASADELASVFRLRGFVPRIIEGRANLARERRDFNEADRLYDSALEEYQSVGSDPAKSDLNYERALLELRRCETARALELIDEMVIDRRENGRDIELALAQQMRGRVLLELGDSRAIDEANASEPLLRRLQCNYYLAIGCYLRARALSGRDVEEGRLALVEFLQLGERFDYSYFAQTEEWFHPALAGLCGRYSIDSPWLSLMLTPNKYATGTER